VSGRPWLYGHTLIGPLPRRLRHRLPGGPLDYQKDGRHDRGVTSAPIFGSNSLQFALKNPKNSLERT
jgi:hypothetical protein